MPRFIVNETRMVSATWSREIEAPTAEEAVEFVKNGGQGENCKEIPSTDIDTSIPEIGESCNRCGASYDSELLDEGECL